MTSPPVRPMLADVLDSPELGLDLPPREAAAMLAKVEAAAAVLRVAAARASQGSGRPDGAGADEMLTAEHASRGKMAALHAWGARPAATLPVTPPKSTSPNGCRLLTPGQAADRLGVSRRWVYAHAAELEGRRLSRKCLRIPAAAVERYVAQRRA
jgi:excisionase family DNA binding protein